MKNARFQFQGNKLGILIEERWERGSLKLDENSNPKGIILTHLDEKGEPMKIAGKERPNDEGIYKFEGDSLVIALRMGGEGAPRPTEFKARAAKYKEGTFQPEVTAVAVVTLKKTNEPIKEMTSSRSPVTAATSRPKGGTSRK